MVEIGREMKRERHRGRGRGREEHIEAEQKEGVCVCVLCYELLSIAAAGTHFIGTYPNCQSQ